MEDATSRWRQFALLPVSIVGFVLLALFYGTVSVKIFDLLAACWQYLFG